MGGNARYASRPSAALKDARAQNRHPPDGPAAYAVHTLQPPPLRAPKIRGGRRWRRRATLGTTADCEERA
ncbi:hypothetical protein GCM10009853_056470 [Glycomyces scopariae]